MSQILVECKRRTDRGFETQRYLHFFSDLLRLEKDDREEMLTDYLRTNERRGFFVPTKSKAKVTEQKILVVKPKRAGRTLQKEYIIEEENLMLSSIWIG